LGLSAEQATPDGLVLQARYLGTLGNVSSPEKANRRMCGRGPSAYDTRDTPVVISVYDRSFGSGKRFLDKDGVENKVLAGWRLNGVWVFHTGNPITGFVDRPSRYRRIGISQSDLRSHALPKPAYLLDVWDGYIRSYNVGSFPLAYWRIGYALPSPFSDFDFHCRRQPLGGDHP